MPELAEVLEETKKDIAKFGESVKELKTSVDKDLATLRASFEESKKAGLNDQQKKDFENLSQGVATKQEALEAQVKKILENAEKEANAIIEIQKKMNRPGATGGGDDDSVLLMKEATEFKRVSMARRGELKVGTILKPEDVKVDEYSEYKRAFGLWLRRDIDNLDERKAMMVGSDPDGGFLVPEARSNRIITKVYETSPLDRLAYHERISTDALTIFIDTDEAGAGWVGETEARPETSTPQVGEQRIPVHEVYAKPKATQQLLEDAGIDVEAWLERKVAEKMARMRATAFISGNGIKKPRGILTYPAGSAGARETIAQIPSLGATSITDNGLVNLTFAIKDKYLGNASFLMKRSTVGAVMLLKDLNGQYMWRPGDIANARGSSMLLGYPVERADDMPAIAGGSLSIAFGDFRAGYTVVDRLGMRVLRDPYSSKPFVEFYCRQRVGGDVVDFEAFALMVTAAS